MTALAWRSPNDQLPRISPELSLASLEARLQKAEDRCYELEELLGRWAAFSLCEFFVLSPFETQLLGLFVRSGTRFLTREAIITVMYADRPECDLPDSPRNVIAQYLCKLRKKIAPYELTIETGLGVGWRLSHESWKKLQNMIKENEARYKDATSSS